MTLDQYLTSKGILDATFARDLSMSKSQIGRLRRGECKPTWPTVKKIAAATNNKVKAADWFSADGVAA